MGEFSRGHGEAMERPWRSWAGGLGMGIVLKAWNKLEGRV